MSKTYGYIRVSTREQNEDRQLIAMAEYGVESAYIIIDKQSGGDFDRPGYKRLLRRIRPGDILVIKSIDRLGRNYNEILRQWRIITKEKGTDIVVLDMPLLNTEKGRDLTGTLIADIVLQLLSYVAETEKKSILERQREGIAAAKARGVRFGRLPMDKPEYYHEIKSAYGSGEISAREAARKLGVSHTCFRNWIKKEQAEDRVLACTPKTSNCSKNSE